MYNSVYVTIVYLYVAYVRYGLHLMIISKSNSEDDGSGCRSRYSPKYKTLDVDILFKFMVLVMELRTCSDDRLCGP